METTVRKIILSWAIYKFTSLKPSLYEILNAEVKTEHLKNLRFLYNEIKKFNYHEGLEVMSHDSKVDATQNSSIRLVVKLGKTYGKKLETVLDLKGQILPDVETIFYDKFSQILDYFEGLNGGVFKSFIVKIVSESNGLNVKLTDEVLLILKKLNPKNVEVEEVPVLGGLREFFLFRFAH